MRPDTSEGAHRIGVRIAVHTARKQVQPDENGLYPNAEDVIFTARMLVNVYGGQIVASDETHRVADSLQWNWQAWPNRRIKSFEEKPYTIHELLYEGWTSREPGSQFVPGWFREKNHYVSRPELENSVADCFARRTGNNNPYRLVTLHGFGGMGKTRLAMQCCLNAAGMFEGQLFLTPLDGIPDTALTSDLARRDYLVGSIARTFGLADPPATPENLPERLPNKGSMLLLLDNYETVKGAASARLIVDMLEARPDLRLLVTGRTPVGLTTGESVQDVEGLQPGEARDLLLTRIGEKKNNPLWSPLSSQEPAITTILEQTARIPLALELVAAHCGDMTLEEIAADLSLEPLGEITETPDGMYSLDPSWRHQTLVKCYNWSWRLLDEEAQFALVCLSLFADRCPTEEITACFDAIKRPHLTRLQQAALATRQEAGGRSVYSLLRPTRLYARKRLQESDDENIEKRHFVAYYRHLARENGGSANTEDTEKRARLESAWRHAMSAADIAGELEDAESSGDIADKLIHFVHRQALWAEGTFLYTRSLDIRRKALPDGHPDIATSLNNLALLYAVARPLCRGRTAVRTGVGH